MRHFSDLGAAVIGSGFIGTVHIEALRRLGVQVHGLLGSDPERGAEAATRIGVPRAYPTLEALLEDPAVDVVHVTSPNQLHYPQVKAILAAGRHVVCEKPLAVTSEESAELVRLAEASDRITAVNFNIRFYPLNQHAHRMVEEGALGEPRLVTGRYFQDWLSARHRLELAARTGQGRQPARGRRHRLPLDRPHELHQRVARHGGHGRPRDVRRGPPASHRPGRDVLQERTSETVPTAMTTEDAALILLRYEGGARGSVAISQVSAGRKNSLQWEIDGSDSAAWWDSETPDHLYLGHRGRPNQILQRGAELMNRVGIAATSLPGGHVEGFADTFHALFREVYGAVLAGRPPEYPHYASFARRPPRDARR